MKVSELLEQLQELVTLGHQDKEIKDENGNKLESIGVSDQEDTVEFFVTSEEEAEEGPDEIDPEDEEPEDEEPE